MNVKRMEKVSNGWVAYNEFGTAVAVATSEEQLADILGITRSSFPHYKSDSVFLNMNPVFNFEYFWQDVKSGRKIDAIKAFRRAFVSNEHSSVTIGLKESKDFVESICENLVYR